MPDPEVVERVDALGVSSFVGEGYRHMGPGYPPLSGEGARVRGGRWNPPNSFPTLYLALDLETLGAEFHRAAEREGLQPEALLPRRVYRYEIRLAAVLDLRDARALDAAGLTDADIESDDLRACQAVGEAGHYLGSEGILAPSAVGPGDVLAIFYSRLRAGSSVTHFELKTWTSLPARS